MRRTSSSPPSRALAATGWVAKPSPYAGSPKTWLVKGWASGSPISAFVATGFEHIPANMLTMPLGLLAGAHASVLEMLFKNFLPTTLGKSLQTSDVCAGVEKKIAGKLPHHHHQGHWLQLDGLHSRLPMRAGPGHGWQRWWASSSRSLPSSPSASSTSPRTCSRCPWACWPEQTRACWRCSSRTSSLPRWAKACRQAMPAHV